MLNVSNNNNGHGKKKFALWMYNRYASHYKNGFILYLISQAIILYVDFLSFEEKFQSILIVKTFLIFLPLISVILINKSRFYKNKFLLYNSIANLLPIFATALMYLHFLEYYNSLASIYFSIMVVQIFLLGLFIYRWAITLLNSFLVVVFFIIVHLNDYPEYTLFKIPYLPFLILVVLVTTLISYYYQGIKEKMFIAEQDLIKERNQIINKNNNLKELNELKNLLFSIIGHDLRSPISGIKNLLKVINDDLEGLSKEELKEYLQTLYKSTGNVYQLLENLLFWGKVQCENYAINPEKISIKELLDDVVALTTIQAKEKNIEIVNEFKDDIEITSDSFILSTVFRNIISNSIKFSFDSGEIKIRCLVKDKYLQFEIEDNGIGMDEKLLNSIFDLDKIKIRTGTNQEQGTGLGLFIVRDLLKKVNGLLTLKSEPNVRTKAIIFIPKELDISQI